MCACSRALILNFSCLVYMYINTIITRVSHQTKFITPLLNILIHLFKRQKKKVKITHFLFWISMLNIYLVYLQVKFNVTQQLTENKTKQEMESSIKNIFFVIKNTVISFLWYIYLDFVFLLFIQNLTSKKFVRFKFV